MPDDFQLTFGSAPPKKRPEPSVAEEFDRDIEYELDARDAPPEIEAEEIRVEPDVNETWYEHYAQTTTRYTVRDLLLATTLIAVACVPLRWLPLPLAAAVLGFLVIFGIVVSASDSAPANRIFHVVFWAVIALYAIVSLWAMMLGDGG